MAQATAFNVSVVFRADTSSAKAEIAEFKREFSSIGTAAGQSTSALAQNVIAFDREAAAALRAAQQQENYATAVRRANDARNVATSTAIRLVPTQSLPSNLSGTESASTMASSASSLAIANTNLSRSYQAVGAEANAALREQVLYRQEMDAIRALYNPLFAASQRYEQELRDIAAAEKMGAISASEAASARTRAAAAMAPMANTVGQFGASAGAAAAYTQNLTFQLNDIAMMMAAGQNPFMLMMQQGTQVTQIFGQMRAGGMSLGTALRAAFGQMLSPMALATMAAIGLGAALVQYLGAGSEEAKTLDETLDDLKATTKDVGSAMREAQLGIFDLRKEFGDGASAAREMNLALLELAKMDAMDSLRAASETMSQGLRRMMLDLDAVESYFTTSRADKLAEKYGLTYAQIQSVSAALDQLKGADGPDAVASAAQRLYDVLSNAKDEAGNIPPELRTTAKAAAEAAVEALRLQGYTEQADRIAKALAGTDLGKPFRDANAAAATLAGTIASLSLSNIGKAAQLAALQGGSSQSSAEVAGKVAEKRAELADALSSSNAETRSTAEGLVSNYEAGLSQDAKLSDQISEIIKARTEATRASGASTKAAEKDAQAVRDLIISKQTELDILREMNPVQQELLRHREELAAATPKQRAEIEGLITVYQAEKERMDEIKAASEEMRSTLSSSFSGLIRGADSFGDALSRVLDKIADMAATSAFDILWDGGLSGGIGSFVNWLIPGKADGGQVLGAGGPREDNLLHWLSNGEFVVNAASTSQYLPLLEAINAGMSPRELMPAMLGRVPALADGGRVGMISAARLPSLVGASTNSASSTPATMVLNANINLSGAQGDRQIEEAARAGVQAAIDMNFDHYDRLILPGRVQQIMDDPRRIG